MVVFSDTATAVIFAVAVGAYLTRLIIGTIHGRPNRRPGPGHQR